MPIVQKNFDAYRIWYYHGHPYEVLIYCYSGGSYVGRMVFFKDEASTPANANYASGPSLHYPVSRFGDIHSILLHENPLYLFLNLDNLIGMLATADAEPTGEEEG